MRGGWAWGGGRGTPGTPAHSGLIVPGGGAGPLLLPLTKAGSILCCRFITGYSLSPVGVGQGIGGTSGAWAARGEH